MDSIIKAGLWETTIGGVKFVSRRKSTAVMIQARGFMAVAGQLAAAKEPDQPEDLGETLKSMARFNESVMRAAIVEPVIAPAGEPTAAGVQYAIEDLQAFADPWMAKFMLSGLTADPTAPSCEA